MPRLSIIIPYCGDQESLDNTLISVLENRPTDCEVLIACGESYRDPYKLEDEVCFVRAGGTQQWHHLVAAALPASQGAVVHVLYPGVRACKGWAEPAIAVMQCDRSVGSISPVTRNEIMNSEHAVVTGVRFGSLGNRRLARQKAQDARQLAKSSVAGPSFMAGFFRREALQSVGPWDTAFGPRNSDIDLGLRLAAKGWRCRVEPASRCAADIRAVEATLGNKGFRYGMSATQLGRRHHRQLTPLAAAGHFPAGLAQALAQFPSPNSVTQIVGRTMGWLIPATAPRQTALRMPDRNAEQTDDNRSPKAGYSRGRRAA